MTWKSTLRSINAAAKRAERESRRRQKEFEARRKQLQKAQELELAQFEVEEYENYIELILSMHIDCDSEYDWNIIVNSPPPPEPQLSNDSQRIAQHKYDTYKPSFFDKIFSLDKKKALKLLGLIEEARQKDKIQYETKYREWKNEHISWSEMVNIGKRILSRDIEAYSEAIRNLEPFSEVQSVGSSITIKFPSPSIIVADLEVHDDKVIPKEQKSLLKSGKLNLKSLPAGKRNEMYQDYICSASLRIGREILGTIPVEKAIINAKGNVLNTATGMLETQPLLSVLLVRETMNKLNFQSIDPSDSMANFICNMKFKKNAGMEPVSELNPTEYDTRQ